MKSKKQRKKKKTQKTPPLPPPPPSNTSYSQKTIVGVDPGKHAILYMTTDDKKIEKRLQYTNVQRRSETGTAASQKKIASWKTEDIQKLEDTLSKCNSRSSSSADFQKYLSARTQVEQQLYQHYADIRFKIYKWWTFRRKQKSEHKLVQNIKKTFLERI